jgi:hypothetical protein
MFKGWWFDQPSAVRSILVTPRGLDLGVIER